MTGVSGTLRENLPTTFSRYPARSVPDLQLIEIRISCSFLSRYPLSLGIIFDRTGEDSNL
jgi:hypothetical protein